MPSYWLVMNAKSMLNTHANQGRAFTGEAIYPKYEELREKKILALRCFFQHNQLSLRSHR